jgi:hypothetical protein
MCRAEELYAHRVLVKKPEGKNPVGKFRHAIIFK